MNELLINIFEHTKAMVNDGVVKTNSHTNKHVLDEYNLIDKNKNATIQIVNSDTVTSALEFSNIGKTAILNMASSKKAGGGVAKGARAQEECLFRCSNLFQISENLYPLQMNEVLYTNDAVFFKNNDYRMIKPFIVDVISVAAVNLNPQSKYNNLSDIDVIENYESIMRDKIKMMFYLASQNNCNNIILGAWGCGVFNNDPNVVARIFVDVIKEIAHKCFDNIVFAVINDHNSVANNYDIFKKYIENNGC
jgi:uncharacterized protein (TIGR02452 family)